MHLLSLSNHFIFGFLIFCLILIASSVVYADNDSTPNVNQTTQINLARSSMKIKGFSDPEMDFQLMRSIGTDWYGGGILGEILLAASEITDGDPSNWPKSFAQLGMQVEKDGRERLAKGHVVSARDALMRASNYYRAAEYYADPRLPERQEFGLKAHTCFIDGINLFDWRVDVLQIPYQDSFLPGYFLSPDKDTNQIARKTILIMSGYDGTSEEIFFGAGRAALERGYNILLFDGPGQVGALRFHPHMSFIPDYSQPITAVVDFALKRKDVDPNQLALYGISLGGYFAASGAITEKRIKALILNSPIVDIHEYLIAGGLSQLENIPEDLRLEDFDYIPDEEMSPKYKISLWNMCTRFGQSSIFSLLEHLKEFNITGLVNKITIPTLAMVGEGEGIIPLKQAQYCVDHVTGPAALHVFDIQSGADSHCQMNNSPLSNAVLYDWLDEIFDEQ
jgi:pimeloyl-ACP methyl ester carboxylesterase